MDSKEVERPVLSHGQMAVLCNKAKEAKETRFLEQSRKRLDKIVTTKMRTAFVGALAAFEDEFGFLWGHGKPEEDKTESEREMFKLWERARIQVLNNGNVQLRAVSTEISNHVVSWNRYHMDIPVRPINDEEA